MDKRPFNLGHLLRPVRGRASAIGAFAAAFSVLPVRADIDPVSGIDFVRIGAVGNAPWPGVSPPVQGDPIGRGGVNYEYHIGRFEWTTAQAVEFFNAAFDRPAADGLPHLNPPTFWGAVATTPTVPGGRR